MFETSSESETTTLVSARPNEHSQSPVLRTGKDMDCGLTQRVGVDDLDLQRDGDDLCGVFIVRDTLSPAG